jgi:hypothetical protein
MEWLESLLAEFVFGENSIVSLRGKRDKGEREYSVLPWRLCLEAQS